MLTALLRTGLEFEPDTDDQAEHDRSVAAAAGVVAAAFPTLLDVFAVSPATRAELLAALP
ncbi:MAG: hypothetical protein ACJ79H_17575 [Myxococcales bacterium]